MSDNRTITKSFADRVADQVAPALRRSHRDGMHLAAKIARDLSEKMQTGELPTLNGPDALRVVADYIERVAIGAQADAPQ